MSSNLLDKGYEPHDVEKRWYDFWEENGFFSASEEDNRKSYSIVIPPPNVTGVLHMGHALNNTLQDILCRYKRLRGYNVLWMPGTDHAGIATQNVVEQKLAKEGLTRDQLGRKQFIEAVWEWRKKYGSAIINQLKRLGSSCDWDRERFTMDEGLSLAVRRVFVDLYHDDLIYQGNYIINWCPRCHTALADLEVEHEEVGGALYHIRYPFADGSGSVIVATTRPETMLGDTAVAVNPEDKRYAGLKADKVILPLMNREIPIIKDSYVDTSFGTGALKVTPAHDPNDYEIGIRHHLQMVKVIGDDGKMTAEAGAYAGMDRAECRKAVLADLDKEGLLEKTEDYSRNVGHCYRCKTVIEPNLSQQWFVRAKPLAEKAIEAVEKGDTRIIPEIWKNTYFDWMYNIKDWCISRQIWWGHQIPAWTCEECGEMVVEMEAPKACPKCQSRKLEQETDVLDTWFSSALWPFSTMGWPEETKLLKTFYPTSTLVTAFDILFFWVARMMMMGIYFMKEVPFKDVYVHALVRDEDGKKMSKSIGNVIDPLDIIDNYGTDAFRFTLAAFAAQGRDIKMSEQRVEGYRHFINKLWNAARFSLMHLKEKPNFSGSDALPDRWIISRMNTIYKEVEDALDNYRFNDAAGVLYGFIWHEFCDWYLEIIKPSLYGKKGLGSQETTKSVLWRILRDALVLLHPFIPFVTEEIWQKIPGVTGSIMKATYPSYDTKLVKLKSDALAEKQMGLLMEIITGVRTVRGEMNIAPSASLKVDLYTADVATYEIIDRHRDIIQDLSKVDPLLVKIQEEPFPMPKEAAATVIVQGVTVYVYLAGIVDFTMESQRLEKEIGKLSNELGGVMKKLSNEDFLANAPEDVVEKVRTKHAGLTEKFEKLQERLKRIKEFEIQ